MDNTLNQFRRRLAQINGVKLDEAKSQYATHDSMKSVQFNEGFLHNILGKIANHVMTPRDVARGVHAGMMDGFKESGVHKHPEFHMMQKALRDFHDHIASSKDSAEAFKRKDDHAKFLHPAVTRMTAAAPNWKI
jgi:hypothetical protein